MKLTANELQTQVRNIVRTLEKHKVANEMHYSIASDIMFDFMVMIDEKVDTHYHESIFEIVDSVFDVNE